MLNTELPLDCCRNDVADGQAGGLALDEPFWPDFLYFGVKIFTVINF